MKAPTRTPIMDRMDPALIAVVVLTLVVVGALVVLDRRLTGLAGELRRLDTVEELSDQVRQLAGELDRKELNAQVQSKITEFTESNRRMTSALDDLRQEFAELRRGSEARAEAAGARADAAAGPDVATLVREHLADAGYEDVQVLSDLSRLDYIVMAEIVHGLYR